MRQPDLIKVERANKWEDISRYQVFGLNIFVANTRVLSPLKEMQSLPFLKFISSLSSVYETICLLGSPALGNWINEMRWRGREVTIVDLLGEETSYSEVQIGYYAGGFLQAQKNGPSVIFRLTSQTLLSKLIEDFMCWDAVAFLLYENPENALKNAHEALSESTLGDEAIRAILRKAKYYLQSQSDCQYLEIHTSASDACDDLNRAALEATAIVTGTTWYRQNKNHLSWDDLELCYVTNVASM
ncbi:MAG: hypothetical protein HYU64_18015 [Armatimonadetes bacterium]|nr:hypothetical protein [Armatimonadota bacterium]